jgi:predicted MPP superfamily phosphohydrolase
MRKFLLIIPVFALVVDAFFIEPYRIEVTHNTLTAAVSSPLKIGLIADIHTRAFGLRERKLISLVEVEKPDVILIAGDTVGRTDDYADVTTLLQHLHAPLGVWLVRGNWENHELPENEHAFYAASGVHFLMNEAQPIRPDVWLLGLDDPSSGAPRPDPALQTIPPGAYAIALIHAPAYFEALAGRVPLAFAGHTHGGQIRIPYVPVFWLPRGSGHFMEGWFEERGSHMYVTRGIGTSVIWARFLSRPELSMVTLEPPANSLGPGLTSSAGKPSVSIGVPQVTPLAVAVQTGASQQFSVTVPCTNVTDDAVCPQGVAWKSSIGTISSVGTFTAPSSPGRGTVTATSMSNPGNSGTATITVVQTIPIAQTCRARDTRVNSLSCSLPSLAAGHTLVAVVRVHGSVYARLESFSDTLHGRWNSANIVANSGYTFSVGALAGGASFFANTKESRSPVSVAVRFLGGNAGDELAVWDFPGVYTLDGPAPAPIKGPSGFTPVLAAAQAGDLVFAWSAISGCMNSTAGAMFTDISLPESCNVAAAAFVPNAPQTNLSNRFSTGGDESVSAIMAFSRNQ